VPKRKRRFVLRPASSIGSGSGNVSSTQVLGVKEAEKPKPKPLTTAQKLAKALKACKKDKNKKKRAACEKLAHQALPRARGEGQAREREADRAPRAFPREVGGVEMSSPVGSAGSRRSPRCRPRSPRCSWRRSAGACGLGHWQVITRSAPTVLQTGKSAEVVTVLSNLGDEPALATERTH